MYPKIYNPSIHKHNGRSKKLAQEDSFRCLHCGAVVYTHQLVSGVQNRNHCPYCLWSRHVDYLQPGDRMSACKGIMQPIALTVKYGRNKYACCSRGELMLVHRCGDCNKLTINRIAADDQAGMLEQIYRASLDLNAIMRNDLLRDQILPLDSTDESMLFTQLYGLRN